MNKLTTLKKWIKREKPGPYLIDLNPTDYCNLKCLSCWQRNPKFCRKLDSRLYQLSDEKLLSLLDEGLELGVEWWEITGGGEPLLRPVTPKLMKKIKSLGMHGNITTNGTLLSEELIKHLVKIGWDKITFSIDSPDPDTNDHLRGKKGAFERSINSLKAIKSLKSRLNKKKPIITFNTVLSNKNYTKAAEMIKLAKKVGCEEVNFEPLTVHSDVGGALKLNQEQIKKFQMSIEKTKETADKLNIKTNIKNFKETDLIEKSNSMQDVLKKEAKEHDFLSIPCYELWYHLVIKVDGTTGPCCVYDDKTMNVKNKSLKEIWYGSNFDNIRRTILKNQFSKHCSICNAGQVLSNRTLREGLRSWMKK